MMKARVLALVDATWPAETVEAARGYRLRRSTGAGRRVSAVSATAPFDAQAFAALLAAQDPDTFAVFPEDSALDAALAAKGFRKVDALLYLEAEIAALVAGVGQAPLIATYPHWPPLAVTREIWAEGGVGPARQAVMARAMGAKAALLARVGEAAAGVGFVALAGGCAMVHALYVPAPLRGQGVGRALMARAALWAKEQGAERLALVVLAENVSARALYAAMGFEARARYHYRVRG